MVEGVLAENSDGLITVTESDKPMFPDATTAIGAMNSWIEIFLREHFTGWMPDQEIASLGDKGRAALNYVDGSPNVIEKTLIETGAAQRGMSPDDYCNDVIIPKARPYAAVIAVTSELRSQYAKLLQEADPSEYAQILTDAQADAAVAVGKLPQ